MGHEDFHHVTHSRQNFHTVSEGQLRPRKSHESRTAWTLILIMALTIFLGRRYLGEGLYSAEKGIGYTLGLTGGILILLAYGYVFAKYVPALRNRGHAAHSLKLHIVLAISGTFFALFHSTFHIGSMNSGVVFVSLVLVFVSGVVGRFLYSRLHTAAGQKKIYERLFYVWRHAHLPLLVLLFFSGVIHVIAVHIY